MATAAAKPAAKKPKKDDEITHLPTPKLPKILNFSVEAEGSLTTLYYANGKHDYANVVFCVNRTMEYGEYEVQVAKDSCSILFVSAICARSFDKIILKKIMKDKYHEGSARVIVWDDTVQEMEAKKVH